MGGSTTVIAQRDGDKIFLNFAKRRKIGPVWDREWWVRPRHRRPRPQQRGGACMEALSAYETYLFEGFRLDRRGLFRRDEGGVFAPVAIGSRAFEVLRVLMDARGDLVSKDEIMAAV